MFTARDVLHFHLSKISGSIRRLKEVASVSTCFHYRCCSHTTSIADILQGVGMQKYPERTVLCNHMSPLHVGWSQYQALKREATILAVALHVDKQLTLRGTYDGSAAKSHTPIGMKPTQLTNISAKRLADITEQLVRGKEFVGMAQWAAEVSADKDADGINRNGDRLDHKTRMLPEGSGISMADLLRRHAKEAVTA